MRRLRGGQPAFALLTLRRGWTSGIEWCAGSQRVGDGASLGVAFASGPRSPSRLTAGVDARI